MDGDEGLTSDGKHFFSKVIRVSIKENSFLELDSLTTNPLSITLDTQQTAATENDPETKSKQAETFNDTDETSQPEVEQEN